MIDAYQFAREMRSALGKVVRLFSGNATGPATSSGWLLTPNLVVVPAYAIDSDTSGPLTVAGVTGSKTWRRTVQGSPEVITQNDAANSPDNYGIALLRITPVTGFLPLALDPADPGDFVAMSGYSMGRPILSVTFGRVTATDGRTLYYDNASTPGTGGGPLFDSNWTLTGIHLIQLKDGCQGLNRGAMIALLRTSRYWPQIADKHKLANLTVPAATAKQEPDSPIKGINRMDVVLRAALLEAFDSRQLSDGERAILADQVVEATDRRWTLESNARRSALESAGGVEAFRKHLPSKRPRTPSQRVIDRIVEGTAFDLEREKEETLSYMLPAVRWFAGLVPGLPTAAAVAKALDRRRVRSRLDSIAGEGFRGRKEQLEEMKKWFAATPPVPLCISGIGGIGKSALVAKFASSLPADTLLLWLDFDRADLAPDDAVSIVAALTEQSKAQLDGLGITATDTMDWRRGAEVIGQALAQRAVSLPPPLLVLDSFEVAQYTERYQQLWPVLEAIAKRVTALRVIVSGRAPVENLKFNGREAQSLRLPGMEDNEVRHWLESQGLKGKATISKVVSIARGVPLIVRLTFQLLKSGVKSVALPTKLPTELIAGYLYRRILRRVRNVKFRELAKGVIVLRRVSPEMVMPVFEGLLPLPGAEPSTWFPEFSREVSLVSAGGGALHLRPEVRLAALRLVEDESPALVRNIEDRAEAWYKTTQDANRVEVAAELVYFRLRRDDLAGAKDAWRAGCGKLLGDEAGVLKPAAAKWLQDRSGALSVVAIPLDAWELDAAERIRALRARGLTEQVIEVLKERSERGPGGPLLFHDAYEVRLAGDRQGALARLGAETDVNSQVSRDRTVLRALLLSETNDREAAEIELQKVAADELWVDRPLGAMEALAVKAARIRLTIDLDLELLAIESPDFSVPGILSPLDIVLPALQEKLRPPTAESVRVFPIPEDPAGDDFLKTKIKSERMKGSVSRSLYEGAATPSAAQQLGDLGNKRWDLVLEGSFLRRAADPELARVRTLRLVISIVATARLFFGALGNVRLESHNRPIIASGDAIVENLTRNQRFVPATIPVTLDEAASILATGVYPSRKELIDPNPAMRSRRIAVLNYLGSREPLEVLVDSLAGVQG